EVDAEEEVQVPAHDDVDQESVIEEIADDVAPPTSPLPPSPIIPSPPPHQSPRTSPSQAAEGTSILVHQVLDKCSSLVLRVEGLESANTAQQLEILKLKARVKKLERLNKVKSSKLRRLKKVGTSQRIESSEDEENVFNQGRISVDIDEGIELVDDQEKDAQVKGRQADTQAEIYNIDLDHTSKVLSMQEDSEVQEGRISVDIDEGIELVDVQEKDAQVKGRQADTQAEIYNIDLDHTSKVLSMQEDSEVQEVVKVVNAAKLITEVVTAATTQVIPAAEPIVDAVSTPVSTAKPKVLKPMKKKDQIAMDAEYARKLQEEEESLAQTKDVQPKDASVKGIQYIRRYHGYKKKPQSESQARKNMIDYLKNTEGFKMTFFKGKTYDQIRPIFQARFDANMRFLLKSKEEMAKEEEEIINSINETPAQKAAKRRRLHKQAKEAKDLKKKLEVVADEDDDVFVEATPIGTK
nr:hypothetical protein [Tanacetum cinerariifolium]